MSSVGRNEPCPCGSGKKYKRCCSAPGSAPGPQPGPDRYATPYPTDQGLHQMLRGQLDQLCVGLHDRNDEMIRFLAADICETLLAPDLKGRYLEVIREVNAYQGASLEMTAFRLKTAAERFDEEPLLPTVRCALLHLVSSVAGEYVFEAEPDYPTMAVFAEAAFWVALEPRRYIKQSYSFFYMTFYVSAGDRLVRLEIAGEPGQPRLPGGLGESQRTGMVKWVDIDRTADRVIRSKGGQLQ